MHTTKKTISIVIPVYNEAQLIQTSIPTIIHAVEQGLGSQHADLYRLEIVAVNDGSADETAAVLANMCQQESRLRAISFTRNFGKEAAILAGLQHAQGDAVVVIDADLQHPPSLIAPMIKLWENGLLVVHAVKAQRARLYDEIKGRPSYLLRTDTIDSKDKEES